MTISIGITFVFLIAPCGCADCYAYESGVEIIECESE